MQNFCLHLRMGLLFSTKWILFLNHKKVDSEFLSTLKNWIIIFSLKVDLEIDV